MRRLLSIYQAKFRAEIAVQFAYRWALVIWLLGLLLEPTVALVVWTTVADSRGGEVGGFTPGDFAAYFTVLMIVNQLTFTWHFFFFEWRVRNGMFSPVLLRPVHPIHNDVAENLTFKLLTFTVVVPVAIFLVVTFGARFETQLWNVVAFLPALVLGMTLRFLVEWTLGCAAFWVTRMAALNQAYYTAMLFLSGQVAPLALFPEVVQGLAAVLPFRWMIASPVEVLLGRGMPPDQVVAGYLAQVAWILAAFVLLSVVWRAGIRRYSAVGA